MFLFFFSEQCVKERVESESCLDNPESSQALCPTKTEIVGPVTDASLSLGSTIILPSGATYKIVTTQEKNVSFLKEDVTNEPRKPIKELDSNQDRCPPCETTNSGSQMDKPSSPSSRTSLPMERSATSEKKIIIKKVSLAHRPANTPLQSQPQNTTSQPSVSSSSSSSITQLSDSSNCSIVLQDFSSRHQSKLFSSDSTEPFADAVSMKENFCEKLEVNEETTHESK